MVTTSAVLWKHVRAADLCPGSKSLEEWLGVRWIHARWHGRLIPILPVVGYRNALILHDIHHVLTGYSTEPSGELELAAWELGSGGCGWSLPFWIDRLGAALVGLVFLPRRTVRAFRRGLRCRNLYRMRSRDVLVQDWARVVARVGLPDSPVQNLKGPDDAL